MSQARRPSSWPWRAGLAVTLIHLGASIVGLALESLRFAQWVQAAMFAIGPVAFVAFGGWLAFRGIRRPRFWPLWWRSQLLFVSLLGINLVVSALAFSLRPEAEWGEYMLWLAPVMWPPCIWPIGWLLHFCLRRAS